MSTRKSTRSPYKKTVTKSPVKKVKKSPVRKSPPRGLPARSPARKTLTRRSPVRYTRSVSRSSSHSPMRMYQDPFEVLSDENILKVLHKLSPEHRMAWINSSEKVRHVYNKHF